MSLASLHADHIRTLLQRVETALARSGHDHLLIASGVLKYQFLDDRNFPFSANPHFLHFVPLPNHTDGWLVISPGKKPILVYHQPADYWHVTPTAPEGFWVDQFDIRIVRTPEEARAHFPTTGRLAIVGEADAALEGFTPNNPQVLMDYLHYYRAFKSPYELWCMRQASMLAARGHIAAREAFLRGESEYDINRAYLGASGQNDVDVPYGNIIGLNEHAAVLHYQHQDMHAPSESRSFLIDAGARVNGYASDITRTWGRGDARFEALIAGVEREELALVDQVRAGKDYREIHVDAHLRMASVLRELGIVNMTPEAQVETGISSAFFPHGIGHLLGIQVHDIGGFSASDEGGTLAKPEGHRYLRLTRTLEPGMVVTIEPGIYFIDMLLKPLRESAHASDINWEAVAHLSRFGGVRIEDDVVCQAKGAPENLSRDAFAAL